MQKLAEAAGVGKNTILSFENERAPANLSTRAAIRAALEDAGVEFIEDYGVSIKPQPPAGSA